ncbi:MAG: DUF3604 domain-containing protein [bacterium]|nr:DUF3604 domain-containing protein [bacterium]
MGHTESNDAPAAPADLSVATVEYSPTFGDDFPTEVFWGDTHVHSSFSMDANTMGNTRLSPADAYRFARGESVRAHNGMTVRLDVPLDFLVVSDHAEYMGLLPSLRAGDARLLEDPAAKRLSDGIRGDGREQFAVISELIDSLMKSEPLVDNTEFTRNIWNRITGLADDHNDPGRFSAMIGYEWSAMPGGDNLHRVVVYRDDASKAGLLIPKSSFEGDRPEDLWDFMEAYERKTGGQILAIPHNPNMSNGQMFSLEDGDGRAFDRDYAIRRTRHEPIAEITQIKGDSESHPLLSPDDEFADFENWDGGNIGVPAVRKTDGQLQYEYLRQALKNGLGEEARLGTNPFKLGLIGSTDSHTSLATAAENDFWGKLTIMEPSPTRIAPSNLQASDPNSETTTFSWSFVASGYAAVWARANTREALFDAMRRREVYATTGSRITLRFFGGWHFEEADAFRPDSTRIGYRKGVPMGSDLANRDGAGAPRFLVSALRDPNGANLDRIQIVKGWREPDGRLKEKVFDARLSDGRKERLFRGPKPIRSTVDVEKATYTNTVGDAALAAFWRDPDFDPALHAFYYVRILEIPTPRWTTYDAVRLGAELAEEIPREIQDRAYSSPIWYTPQPR